MWVSIKHQCREGEGAEAVKSVFHVRVLVPEAAAEPADRPLAGGGVVADRVPVQIAGRPDLVKSPASGERREQVGGGDTVVRPQAALKRRRQARDEGRGGRPGFFVNCPEYLEQSDASGGGIRPAPLHRRD